MKAWLAVIVLSFQNKRKSSFLLGCFCLVFFLSLYEFQENLLLVLPRPIVNIFFFIQVAASVFLVAGIWKRTTATLLLLGMFVITKYAFLIYEINWPFIGWLLLVTALLDEESMQDPWFVNGTWVLFGICYTLSGINKMSAVPYWLDGDAITRVMHPPLTRFSEISEAIFKFNPLFSKLISWSVLIAETSAFLSAFIPRTRKTIFWSLTVLHVGIAIFTTITLISLGMLVFHFFLYEITWRKPLLPIMGRIDIMNKSRYLTTEERLQG